MDEVRLLLHERATFTTATFALALATALATALAATLAAALTAALAASAALATAAALAALALAALTILTAGPLPWALRVGQPRGEQRAEARAARAVLALGCVPVAQVT